MNPEFLAFSLVILLFSVIIHEVMHGWVALQFGDHTAERLGRLTLNPLPHIDPIGSILLPTLLVISGSPFLIGWAKPVPVNPLNFSNLQRGELFVSAAGILSNFALSLISAALLHLLVILHLNSPLLIQILTYGVLINLLLGIFNLLPIPPLDGSKVLLSQLPYRLAKEYEKIEPYGFFLLALLLFSGMLEFVYGLALTITKLLI